MRAGTGATTGLRLPIPGSFESRICTTYLRVADLVRLSQNPSTEPYWGKHAAHRFDDPTPSPGTRFGVTYAGVGLAVAFCESVIHEATSFKRGSYVIAEADLCARHAIRYTHKAGRLKRLNLCNLTGDALKSLGLNADLTTGSDYTVSQQWARAIHAARPDVDGVLYRSRQLNDGLAVAVFERSGLVPASGSEPLVDMPELASLLKQFNVALLP